MDLANCMKYHSTVGIPGWHNAISIDALMSSLYNRLWQESVITKKSCTQLGAYNQICNRYRLD